MKINNSAIDFPIKYKKDCGFLGCNYFIKRSKSSKKEKIKYAILGLPFDNAVTNRKGAKYAPEAIRKASLMLCDAFHPYIISQKNRQTSPILPTCQLIDFGDLKISSAIAKMQKQINIKIYELIKKYHLISIGGDHSVTYPILKAYYQKNQKPLALVHFDAHCDTWRTHKNLKLNHGSWLYHAHKQGFIDIKKTIQLGIRSPGESEYLNYVSKNGGIIISAKDLRGFDGKALQPFIKRIQKILKNLPVYLSIDIDVLDPAFAPGTGTPETAGLTTNQLLTFIEELSLNYVGMDCVEVNPQFDYSEITSLAAANIIWTYICKNLQNTH